MHASIETTPAIRSNSGAHPARKDQRSAVTNGKRLHVVRPGDTAWSRRFRDVLAEIISDIRTTSREGLSEGQRQLARRAATISIMCEKMEGDAAAGAEIDVDAYGMLTDRLGRAFARLGLKRQSRDVYIPARERWALEAAAADKSNEDEPAQTAAEAETRTGDDGRADAAPSVNEGEAP